MSTTAPAVSFGPSEVPDHRRILIEFRYLRDEDRVETQTFNVLDKAMDMNAANRLMRRTRDSDAEAIAGLVDMISKFMDNKDGTPANWQPVELAAKKGEEPPVKRFRGPDGKPHPWAKAEGFLATAAGSSRRRWLHLMNEDDGATVEQDTLIKLLEFLMEIAGKDRTPA